MNAGRSRASLWLSRAVLAAVTVLLALISRKYLFDPTGGASERGIVLSTRVAVTVTRVGFGGFPLACAIAIAWCMASAERVRMGLWFVVTLFATVLGVRVLGALADASLTESMTLIVPEIVFLSLAIGALALGSRNAGHRHTQPAAAGDRQ